MAWTRNIHRLLPTTTSNWESCRARISAEIWEAILTCVCWGEFQAVEANVLFHWEEWNEVATVLHQPGCSVIASLVCSPALLPHLITCCPGRSVFWQFLQHETCPHTIFLDWRDKDPESVELRYTVWYSDQIFVILWLRRLMKSLLDCYISSVEYMYAVKAG